MPIKPSTFWIIVVLIIACVVLAFLIPQTEETPSSSPPAVITTENPGIEQKIELSEFCLGGCPAGAPADDQLVIHHILELDNNPHTRFADWVAYKITTETLGSGCKRLWERDPDLDAASTLSPSDYRGIRAALASDRGHQAPLASLCGSPYWQEADYLSNITPQKSDLNEGTWERLENSERKLVTTGVAVTVYSLTGPLFEKAMPELPQSHLEHRVPSGYWKVISITEGSHISTAAFIMDQDLDREADFCGTGVSLDDVERRTHLQFFPEIASDQKKQIENSHDLFHQLGC